MTKIEKSNFIVCVSIYIYILLLYLSITKHIYTIHYQNMNWFML